MVRQIIGFAVAITCFAANALGWPRFPVEDEQAVARSELIVVGRLKFETIKRVEHRRDSERGSSWEHHATLVVESAIKGDSPGRQIPVIIHYGLDPSVSDGVVEIRDTGANLGHVTVIPDAAANCIWLLRRIKDRFGSGDGKTYGVEDPEDLQPLEFEEYMRCYLAPDPEVAVRAHIQKQPAIAERATRYLVHCEIARIRKLPDAAQRVERLLPYWLSRSQWGYRDEATEGMREAGAVAGPYLEAVFHRRFERRDDIIRLWGEIGYRHAVPRLIGLLEEHDRFWAAQTLEKRWWNKVVDSRVTSHRRDVYSETYGAVVALGQLGDASARDVVVRTRARWAAINFENPQIVEACDAILKKWSASGPQ